MFKSAVSRLGYASRDGLSVVTVPVAGILGITTVHLAMAQLGLVQFGYLSPYVAGVAVIAHATCLRAALLAVILTVVCWYTVVLPPAYQFKLPNFAEITSFASMVAVAFYLAPRQVKIAAPAAGGETKARDPLPFVDTKPNGNDEERAPMHCPSQWSVDRTGDWDEQDDLGREYGRIFVDRLHAHPSTAPPLSWIVRDMIEQGEFTGVEAGFMATVERAIREGRRAQLPLETGVGALLRQNDTHYARAH